jgi:GntR family transcriptional regulator
MFRLDPSDPTPLYAQLEWAIRAAIATGKLREADRLPTVRQLAVDLRVNANTVAKVYGELEHAGVLETRRGVGTFVRAVALADPVTGPARRLELAALADRFLAGAAALGFTVDEAIEHLRGRRSEQETNDG